MSFDEEHIDPHGECAAEIHRLRAELVEAREGREYWIRQAKNQVTRVGVAFDALAAAQASERERCAKVCGDIAAKLALRAATAADGEWACVFGYQEVAVEECEAAIRALSPTPNQEKPDAQS